MDVLEVEGADAGADSDSAVLDTETGFKMAIVPPQDTRELSPLHILSKCSAAIAITCFSLGWIRLLCVFIPGRIDGSVCATGGLRYCAEASRQVSSIWGGDNGAMHRYFNVQPGWCLHVMR